MKEENWVDKVDPDWLIKRDKWIDSMVNPLSWVEANEIYMTTRTPTLEGPAENAKRALAWLQLTTDSRKKLESMYMTANGYGICDGCLQPAKLHQSNLAVDDEGNISSLCWDCLKNNILSIHLRWDRVEIDTATAVHLANQDEWNPSSNPMSRSDMSRYLFHSDSIAPIHVEDDRSRCYVCRYYVLKADEYGVAATEYRWIHVEANFANQNTVPIHSKCGNTCEWDNCNVKYVYRNAMTYINNKRYCINHGSKILESVDLDVDEDYIQCDGCCGYWTSDYSDVRYSDLRSQDLCDNCYTSEWECSDCGNTIYGEDEDHTCEYDEDDDEPNSDYIHSYGYKPRPVFFGMGPIFLGFELEVEAATYLNFDEREFMASRVMDSSHGSFYLKEDGSLSNSGFEIVTHPHSLQEYQTKFDWKFLESLKTNKWRSWYSDNCGLHVHIGLSAFVNAAHEAKFTKFIYDNQRQVVRIAGRSSNYASFSDKGKAVRKIKYKDANWDRYQAVNNLNRNTLEIRVFKGSLRQERVLSAIEFVHAVCEYTRTLKAKVKGQPFSWVNFVGFVSNNLDTYPNLFTIINESFTRREPQEEAEVLV